MRYLVTLSLALFISSCQQSGNDHSTSTVLPSTPPNILVLLADDLGYGDLSSYGGIAKTPHLDQMAADGIRMTQFYSAAPNCSPARAGLLTGLFPSKAGIYNYMPPKHPMHLKDHFVTIAEITKQAGYATGHFGKWHLSNLVPDADLGQAQPDQQGFDYSLGTTNNSRPSHLNPINFVRNGVSEGEMEGYSCQIIVDEAIQWLDEKKDPGDPFLLYMAFHEPHLQLASPPELVEKYSHRPERDAVYYANVENLDIAIGRLMDRLSERGMLDNTLVIFASDNGSYHRGSNDPLLGGKSFVYEGGIRVPGIFYWKDVIQAGQTNDDVASLVDLMPTLCELTGINHPSPSSLDGTSLVPLLTGNKLAREKPLSWFFYRTFPQMAMRIGEHVILGGSRDTVRHTHPMTSPDMGYIKNLQLDTFEVYDLTIDPGQKNLITISDLKEGNNLHRSMIQRLEEIQANAPYWENLPPDTGRKRLKTEWRKLRWDSFSN